MTRAGRDSFATALSVPRPGVWRRFDVPGPGSDRLGHLAASHAVPVSCLLVTATLLVVARYLQLGDPAIRVEIDAGGSRTIRIVLESSTSIGDALIQVREQYTAPVEPDETASTVLPILLDCRDPCEPTYSDDLRLAVAFDAASKLVVHYRAAGMARWLAGQFGRHVQQVLDHWFDDHRSCIADLDILRPAERERCLTLANGPVRDYPLDRSPVAMFDDLLARSPDRVAVIEDETPEPNPLSYRALAMRSDAIARSLSQAGIGPRDRVAVRIAPSSDSIAALLAIWRVGAVYVPIDHAMPEAYARFILADSGASLCVADERPAPDVPPQAVPELYLGDVDADARAEAPPAPPGDIDAPCLILYTSGSTGRPKGVVHCQRQILNRLHWMWDEYPLTETDVLVHRSPPTVMPSLWEMLGGLLSGHATAIASRTTRHVPTDLIAFLARTNTTVMTLTPTVLRLLLNERPRAHEWPRQLRFAIIGGEPLSPALYSAFRTAFPAATLVDDFGATEVNTMLHAQLNGSTRLASAGYRPIANVEAFVLDERLRPVAFGVRGELCIAGPSLALGYHALPDVTADRFVEVALAADRGQQRLYRTGDMFVVAPDGRLRSAGRLDHQIKVRGLRVELGEVERTIANHPAVAECVVIPHVDGRGRTRLDAHLRPRNRDRIAATQVRAFVASRLPAYMVPHRLHWVDDFPRRPNGKLDRLALAARAAKLVARASPGSVDLHGVTPQLRAAAADVLGVPIADVDPAAEFVTLGIDSLMIIDLAARVSKVLDRDIVPTLLFDHPSIVRLSAALAGRAAEVAAGHRPRTEPVARGGAIEPIAIIGMSGCFPGALDIDAFWSLLRAGVDSTGLVPPDRWDAEAIYDLDPAMPDRSISKWGGFLDDVAAFDPGFFALSPADARAMDPQQRLCLMAAWHALENAGQAGARPHGDIGVFVGARASGYDAVLERAGRSPGAATLLGNDLSLIASRVAYFCDFSGPALTVDTACSSSLVAIHLACQSLASGDCTMALAGGVSVTNSADFYVATSKLGIFSPTGQCRAFDAAADGFVHGEGVGFVVLKSLTAAIADGDHVRAVLRGVAVNQDGRSNGITAPNGDAQRRLQTALYERLGVDPATIGYVEAHGTATPLGDPIEVQALTRSFRRFTDRTGFCGIGSVKTNIGHLTAAAGIAGLIKTVLCLEHGELVPSLHFDTPNPHIDFAASPFNVVTASRRWEASPDHPRRAAVNAFGIGGTNAHCVVEAAPPLPAADDACAPAYLVPVVAPDRAGARRMAERLHDWIDKHPDPPPLRDIAWSMIAGRRWFDCGHLVLARDIGELRDRLAALTDEQPSPECWPLDRDDTADAAEADASVAASIASLERGAGSAAAYCDGLRTLAGHVAAGTRPDWTPLFAGARRVPLPGYPFATVRYWPEPERSSDPAPTGSIAERVAAAVADLLEIALPALPCDRPLSQLGLDSIRAMALKHVLERATDREVPLDLLLSGVTVTELAASLDASTVATVVAPPRPIAPAPAGRSTTFALTDMQAAHLVARLTPEGDPVGCHTYFEFSAEDLDPVRLEASWQRLVVLHPMLRADVLRSGRQRIRDDAVPAFDRHHVARSDFDAQVIRVRDELSHRRYDAGDWPLYDIRITSSDGIASRVHVSMDGWIADGASANFLHREWRRLYQSLDAEPRTSPATFCDFVEESVRLRETPAHDRATRYWREKLDTLPSGPSLPRRADSGEPRHIRSRLHHKLGACSEGFAAAVVAIGVTPSAAVLELLVEQLRALGQPRRFALIVTNHNRPALQPEFDHVIGPFSSATVFVAEPGATSRADRMRACQRQVARDLEHGSVSAAAALGATRADMRGEMPQLAVVFSSALGIAADGASWLDLVDEGISQTPGIDLDFQIVERDGEMQLILDAALGRFEDGAIEALFDRLCAAIAGVAADGLTDDMTAAAHATRARRTALIAAIEPARLWPMTPLQQTYAAHRLIAPDAPAPAIYRQFALAAFDPAALQASLDTLLARTPQLRAARCDTRAAFDTFPLAALPLEIDDLRGDDEAALAQSLDAIRAAMLAAARTGGAWPPVAVRLSRLGDGSARLHVLADPAVFDGFGVWRFYQDLIAPPPGPAASPQPLAAARHAHQTTVAGEEDRRYWEAKMAALPPGPQWPGVGATEPTRAAAHLGDWAAVAAAAAARDIPAVALLTALYAETLHRWTVPAPLTIVLADFPEQRAGSAGAGVYGDCTSLAWIPSTHSATMTVEDCARAHAEILARDALHDWGDPFTALRNLEDEHPRFGAVLTNALGAPDPSLSGLREIASHSYTPGIDLDLVIRDADSGLTATFQTGPGSLPADTVKGIARDFLTALEGLLDDTAWRRPLAELGRGAGTVDPMNRTDAAFDREQLLHRLLECQAARAPDSVAVIGDGESLSHGMLERRANQLAHHLRRAGVQRGSRVGVLLDRTPAMVVVLQAILKAGGAYVPIGRDEPRRRIESMLQQAGVTLVVTQTDHAGLLDTHRPILCLDAERDAIGDETAAYPPEAGTSADDLAYVIFTSGTTGQPKGVAVQHRPVINLVEWAHRRFAFGAGDRVLFVNALGFDLSVFDLFGVLAAGGSVRIASDDDRLDPARLATLLETEPITFWNSTPSYLDYLLRSRGLVEPMALRLVFLSGDRIGLDLARDVRQRWPSAQAVSLGGATEATIWSNVFEIETIDPDWTSLPYGRPIQNARCYVLDEALRPAPSGATGELFIGGDCLATGYVGLPEESAARFLPDPFHERPGMRMYRTGDLVRLLASGDLEIVGRTDDQVKLRGFRIELLDVEAGLLRAGLANPVAVVREDIPGARRLAAFAVSDSHVGRIDDPVFTARLAELLPEYMIPDVVLLPALPLTANGKVDRKRLASASIDELLAPSAKPLPLSSTPAKLAGPDGVVLGEILARAIEETLGVPAGAIVEDTHFSALGVTSLHFAVLSARIADETGITISPAKLFRCTSVAQVVAAVEKYRVEAPASPPSVAPSGIDATPPDAHAGELAIIGMHARMPQSHGLEALWDNLVNGRDCLEQIPADRWDWRVSHGGHDKKMPVANRAGFIDEFDRFDARFFGVSPREAETMDPRQRLLLEGVWALLEDAGHPPSTLRGEAVGVFVGATGDEFGTLLGRGNRPIDQFTLTGTARSLLANRISYWFGWHGPSDVIDTTCSSSLVALHHAARAIAAGDCTMAVVGGINLMIDSAPHLSLANVGVLSPDAMCRSFDAGANGYARGEGLGMVLLKPLATAEADGDRIQAVVCGTAVNHGGRANALTAPNPRAQARVIVDAHRRSGIALDQIGHIEAHGTGTPLGDPIEIEGLKEAFATLQQERGPAQSLPAAVRIGSVKTSIGHLEAAAGIAGVIKTVLMLDHKVLPPLVHLRQLNPQIDVAGTPFRFDAAPRPWPAPIDRQGRDLPRGAGVSSFGLGGVNAHIVLREYMTPVRSAMPTAPRTVVPLSAHSDDRLAALAERLRDSLATGAYAFEDVARTLQIGREAFAVRAAIVAGSIVDLSDGLAALCERRDMTTIHRGTVTGRAGPASIDPRHRAPDDLARAWVEGAAIDWTLVPSNGRRIRLPTYPFERDTHWPAELRPGATPGRGGASSQPRPDSFILRADDAVIGDHRIDGATLVPAAWYLSVLAHRAGPGARPLVKGMTWTRPLRLAGDRTTTVTLSMSETAGRRRVTFVDDDRTEYASAELDDTPDPGPWPLVDLAAIRRRCRDRHVAEACYDRLREAGVALGPALRVIRAIWTSADEALAEIALPGSENDDAPDDRLPVAAVDGALQTAALHTLLTLGSDAAFIPFSIRRVRLGQALPRRFFAHVVRAKGAVGARPTERYDIALVSVDGEPLLELTDCAGLPRTRRPVGQEIALFVERWQPARARSDERSGLDASIAHLTIGLPRLADALAQAKAQVLANVLLPGHRHGTTGSAVPWRRWIADSDAATIALWYDGPTLCALSDAEQRRVAFDTVSELARELIAARRACRLVIGIVAPPHAPRAIAVEALSGLLRTVQAESPQLRCSLLYCQGLADAGGIQRALASVSATGEHEVEHRIDLATGRHERRVLETVPVASDGAVLPVEPGAAYLIAGAGAIGRRIAAAIVDQGGEVVLLGRSATLSFPLGDPEHVTYIAADVQDARALKRAIAGIHDRFGRLRGVFHCAGEMGGGLLLKRSLEDAHRVIDARMLGARLLDEATAAEPLDFFVLCSSLASLIGPVGGGDYAYASRHADLYAPYRQGLVERGLRRGKSLTVGWPIWIDGAHHPSESEQLFLQARGLRPIDTASALRVLAAGLAGPPGHLICGFGDRQKIACFLTGTRNLPVSGFTKEVA